MDDHTHVPEQRATPRRHCTPRGWGRRFVCSLSAERCHNCSPPAANQSCAAARRKESSGGADHRCLRPARTMRSQDTPPEQANCNGHCEPGSAPKCASQGCRKVRHAQDTPPMEANLGRRTPHRRCTNCITEWARALHLPGAGGSPPAPPTSTRNETSHLRNHPASSSLCRPQAHTGSRQCAVLRAQPPMKAIKEGGAGGGRGLCTEHGVWLYDGVPGSLDEPGAAGPACAKP